MLTIILSNYQKPPVPLKGWDTKGGTFCMSQDKKHNVHRFKLNLHSLKIMIEESFPENITCRGAVVFGKWVKQCHENNF